MKGDLPTARFWAFKAEEKQVSVGDVESQRTKKKSQFSSEWRNPGQSHTAQLQESLLQSLSSQDSEESSISKHQVMLASGLVLAGDMLIATCVRDSLLKEKIITHQRKGFSGFTPPSPSIMEGHMDTMFTLSLVVLANNSLLAFFSVTKKPATNAACIIVF